MSNNRLNTKKFVAVSAIALCAAGMMPSAFAQDDAEAEGEDVITITGFRASLAEALDIKREETGVVDAIVAEDIADFPDLNLAESLQRIPGVAITREAGEGRQITVRGLSGDFTRVRINGMDALATGGGSDASGGNNRSRRFDFNTFASDLFNQLVVRKTQSASIEEGSLGANVELQTAHPLDYDAGFTFAASGQALYNDLVGETSPRLAGLASWKSDDGIWGALVSVAYQDRTVLEEGFSSVRFDDQGTFRSVDGTPCASVSTGPCQELRDSWYARIPRYGRLTYDQQRLGLTGSVQFQPSDRTLVTFDALYSELDATRDEEFLQVFIRSNTDNIDVTDYTVNSDGVLEYLQGTIQADMSNGIIPMRSEHRQDQYTTEFKQFTAKVEQEFTDNFRAEFFAGTSSSTYDNPVQGTIFFDAANPVEGYTYDFGGTLELPEITYGNFDVADPSSYLFTQYRNRPQSTENGYDALRADFMYDLNDAWTLSAGLSWKEYSFETSEIRIEGDVADLSGFSAPVPVTDALTAMVEGFGDGLDYPSANDTSWVSADWDAAADMIGLLDIPGDIGSRAQDNRAVEEEDTGAYVQADFDFNGSGLPVRGDVGVRYVETKVASTGYINVGGSFEPVTVDRSYTDTLPALNVVWDVSEDFLLRGGVAKVMARPDLGNLSPGGSIDTFTGPPFAIDQGNPGLDPYRATAYDLSAEWYFAENSLLAASVFYKDVASYFASSQTIETTFSQTGLPESVASATSPLGELLANGGDPAVTIDQTVNGSDAALHGFELAYQQPFTFLPAPFDDFGFVGNYTWVDSDEISDFSPVSHNATLYYENDRFSARLSGAYRDAYVTRQPNSSGRTEGREERGVAETYNVDFASSWAVTDNLDLTFEGINLTDEVHHQTFDRLKLPTVYHHTGRNFLFGVRWRQ